MATISADDFSLVSDEDCDHAEPNAAAMIESLRAFGYQLPSAVADLVDNSIFAKAKNIWIDFSWNGAESTICITDDGVGMNEQCLVDAMRPGSRNPLESRDAKDLGRFGLGLKTASFSQCRRLVVVSKQANHPETTRCWDLDFVAQRNKWLLLRDGGATARGAGGRLRDLQHGTAVLWQKMDRLVADQDVDDDAQKHFFHARIEAVERHLGMVYHRFLAGGRRLRIHVNGNVVAAWDPFLTSEPTVQHLPEEELALGGARVSVSPYVLPHVSRLSPEVHARAAGPAGWNQQQGFYVYRNERLLVAGEWLGLPFAKEEHFKLARIQLDLPNTVDHEWEIDVTKSKARMPDALRVQLKRIADATRRQASAVYRHRGKVLARQASSDFVFVWQQVQRRGKFSYRVNRAHPLVAAHLADTPNQLLGLLRLIEETVPIPLLTMTNSEHPDAHTAPFEGANEQEVTDLLRQVYQAMRDSGCNVTQALERVAVMEPFDRYPALVAALEDTLRGL